MDVMRAFVLVLLVAASSPAAELDADQYFEVGVDYLKKGHFEEARAAFSESLVRAPGQPVTIALCAVAGAAEGRPTGECALLLRWAVERTPPKKRLRFKLHELLPSPRALALLKAVYARRAKAPKRKKAALTVLAFLELQDADPGVAKSLDLLLRADPKDAYARALDRMRRPPAEVKP